MIMDLAVYFAVVALYLLVGWQAARLSVPRAWVAARKRWNPQDYCPQNWNLEDCARTSAKTQTTAMIMGWPVGLTVLLVSQRFNTMIDRGDPEAAVRETAAREQWIAEAEKDLERATGFQLMNTETTISKDEESQS